MIILAIESASKSVSVALLDDEKLILHLDSDRSVSPMTGKIATPEASNTVAPQTNSIRLQAGSTDQLPTGFTRKRSKGSSRTSRVFPPGASVLLAPLIQTLFQESGHSIKNVDLVATSIGPGLFTGLRVGVVTAKTLAYSVGAEVMGINTLEAIATQASEWIQNESNVAESMSVNDVASVPKPDRIRPIVNAQREQFFAGCFSRVGPWSVKESIPSEIIDRERWMASLQPGDVLTGPSLKSIQESIKLKHGESTLVPESVWSCTAETVGRLANRKFLEGKRDSLWELEPLYFRPSAAEEVRAAKLAKESNPE